MSRRVLLTGGAGYVGRHVASSLIEQGIQPVLLDNFSESSESDLSALEACTNTSIPWVKADIRDTRSVVRTLKEHSIDSVIHLAALKSVVHAEANSELYMDNNVAGSESLCDAMEEVGLNQLIFSSTAAVYEHAGEPPNREDAPISSPTSVYARSKRTTELNLARRTRANHPWHIACLRYFNPIGAHPSGLMGENPLSTHGGLQAAIAQTYLGVQSALRIHGAQHPTPDGSPLRDFLHISDLASAHSLALNAIDEYPGIHFFNVGLGQPHSVLEVASAFSAASHPPLPVVVGDCRPGDVSASWCCADKIRNELGWIPQYSVAQAMQHLKDYLDHYSANTATIEVHHV